MSVSLHRDPAAGRVAEQFLRDARMGTDVHEQTRRSVPHVVEPHPRQTRPQQQGLEVLREPRALHSRDGQVFKLADAAERYGRDADPSAFVGIVGAVNRPMRRLGGRRLIEWEAVTRGYEMDRADAAVVLEALGE